MINLPTPLWDKFNSDIAIDPIIIVEVDWGSERVAYSTIASVINGVQVYDYVRDFGSFELVNQADGFGQTNSIRVTFNDTFGHFKIKYDLANIYNRDRNCTVWLGESSVSSSVKLFDGVMEDVNWNDETRTMSCTITDPVEDETINYSPSLSDIDEDGVGEFKKYYFENAGALNEEPWPHVFGTVRNLILNPVGQPFVTELTDTYSGQANDASHTLKIKDSEYFPLNQDVEVLITGEYENRYFAIKCLGKRTTDDGFRDDFVILGSNFNQYIYNNISTGRVDKNHVRLLTQAGTNYTSSDPVPWLPQAYLLFQNPTNTSYSGGSFKTTLITYCLDQQDDIITISNQGDYPLSKIIGVQRMWPTAFTPGTVLHSGGGLTSSIANWSFLLEPGTKIQLWDHLPSRQFVVDSKQNALVINVIDPTSEKPLSSNHYTVKSTDGTPADPNRLWDAPAGAAQAHPECTYLELRHDAIFRSHNEFITTKEPTLRFDNPSVDVHTDYYQQVDVIKYVSDNYSNLNYSNHQNNRACNFAIHSPETFSEFLTSFAWQNGQGLRITNGDISFVDLSDVNPTVRTLTADDIIHKTLILGVSDIGKVKTDFEWEHQTFDYGIEPTIIKRKENVAKYGVQELRGEYYVNNEPGNVLDFWTTRLSDQYKTLQFRTSFKHLGLEIWDRVVLKFGNVPLEFYDVTKGTPGVIHPTTTNNSFIMPQSGLVGYILAKEVDFNDRTILLTIWSPMPVNSNKVKPSIYPKNLSYTSVDSKLTQFRTIYGLQEGGSHPNSVKAIEDDRQP